MHDELTNRAIRRAAIADWRDAATMAAIAQMHEAATNAMIALEDQLDKVAVADAAFNHATLAQATVQSAMCDGVERELMDWLAHHAGELRAIDPRLEQVAKDFSEWKVAPPEPQPQPQQTDEPVSDESRASWLATPAWLSSSIGSVGSAIGRAATTVTDRAIPDVVRENANRLIDETSRQIGERSGIRDWVRGAGRDALAREWLGTASARDADQTPALLTQLFERIDRASSQARAAIA